MPLINRGYNFRNIKKSRHNRKTGKQIVNTYFIIATLIISTLAISALSVLNYSVNQETLLEFRSLHNNSHNNSHNSIPNPIPNNIPNNIHNNNFDKQQQNNSCAYCKDLVHIINLEFEKYNKTIEDIVDIIKNICTLIHAPIVSQECIFISNNIEKILNWTNSGMNSTIVCRKLHLCDYLPIVVL
tara:strand:- start:2413 stop:2967 length:555 start_codon:yes stop_codon:yes gene_type:complete